MKTLNNIEKAAKSIIDICNKKKSTKSDKDKLIEYQQRIAALIDNLMECDNCDVVSDSIATITLNGVTANLCQDCGVKALKAGKIDKRGQLSENMENEQEEAQSIEESNSQSSSQILKNQLSQIPHLPNDVIESLAKNFKNPQDIANATVKELQNIEGIGETRALRIKEELAKIKSQQSTDSNIQNNDASNESEEDKEPEIDWDELYAEIIAQTNLKKNEIKHIHKLIDEIALPMELNNTVAYVTAEIEMSKLKLNRSDTEKAVTMLMDKSRLQLQKSNCKSQN